MENFVAKLPDILKPWGEEMLLRYVDFKGTTDRKKFWTVFLTNLILSFIVGLLAIIPVLGWILAFAWSLGFIIPALAMQIRRLQDTGKHWAYIFFGLIPLAGFIILIVFYCQE